MSYVDVTLEYRNMCAGIEVSGSHHLMLVSDENFDHFEEASVCCDKAVEAGLLPATDCVVRFSNRYLRGSTRLLFSSPEASDPEDLEVLLGESWELSMLELDRLVFAFGKRLKVQPHKDRYSAHALWIKVLS